MQKPKHILVFRFSAMGDVAMTVPVLLALTNQYEDVRITIVTRSFFKPIFQNIPNVTVFTADFNYEHKGVLGLYKLSRQLLKLEFDVIADLHNVLRTTLLKLFLSGKPVITIDKGRDEKKALTKGKIFKQLKPTTTRYTEVFHKLGFNIDLSKALPLPKSEIDPKLNSFLNNDGLPNIGVAPFAAHKGKMYPLDLMRQVIIELAKNYNIILFGGGQHEIKYLNEIEKNYTNIKSAAGKLKFNEELILISNLDLMLSMDSGNGHLAAMYGIKVVTIWGVTHPYAGFAPFNQPESYSLTANREKFPLIPTSIYGNSYPKTYEDVSGSISPDRIVELINDIC